MHASHWLPPTTLVIGALATLARGAAALQGTPPTVPGPESAELLAGVQGWVVMACPLGGIVAWSVPDAREIVVRAAGEWVGTVHSLSGPDRQGRVAFIEDQMMEERHALKVIDIDGNGERLVLERWGDALWSVNGDEIGDHLALAPIGGRVAFVADIELGTPRTLLRHGTLSIWDVDENRALDASALALDEALSWFPDGRRLAYVDSLDNAAATQLRRLHVPAGEEFGQEWRDWPRVPVVCVIDVETCEHHAVHVGAQALSSPNGRDLLVRDSAQRWRILDLEQNVSRAVEAVGRIHPGAIAFVDPERVLYWSWPTEGAVGKPLLALKLLQLSTGAFQTLPGIDPRGNVSFGSAER